MKFNVYIPWLLISAILLFPVFSLLAQNKYLPETIEFEIFELPGGELGNHCQSIVQDSLGFMWFGTQYGLHRWDGYEFKTYRHDPSDSTSISWSYVEYIYVAKDGTLWLGTWGGGLNHFDQKSEKFTYYLHNINDENSLSNNYVSEIIEDDDGYLWMTTQDGVNRLNLKTKQFKRFYHDPNDPSSLSYNICRTVYKDKEGVLWFGAGWAWENEENGGLNRYHPDTESFTRYFSDPKDSNSINNNKVFEIFEDSRNNFWVGTMGHGVQLLDRKAGSFTPFKRELDAVSKLNLSSTVNSEWHDLHEVFEDHHTKFIFEDNDKKIWIGEWLGGLKYYDPQTGSVQHFFQRNEKSNSIPDNYLWQMFQSKDGTLWGSTAGPGGKVFKIKKQLEVFGFMSNLSNDIYSAYCESRNGDQWFAGRNTGLIKVDGVTKDTFQYLEDPQSPNAHSFRKSQYFRFTQNYTNRRLAFQNIFKIVEDQNGILWMGKADHIEGSYILLQFDPVRQELKTYTHDPTDENSIGKGMFMDLLVDTIGRVWVTTELGELNLYHPKKDNFSRFSFANDQQIEIGLTTNIYSVLTENKEGNILIAHSSWNASDKSIYLDQFDPDIKKFIEKTIVLPPRIAGGVPQTVVGIKEDKNQNIWVCTGFRFHKINPRTGKIENLDALDFGLSFIKSFMIDNLGQIWLAGESLTVYDPTNDSRNNYGVYEGIKNTPFGFNSLHQRSDGQILVGGSSGYLYFYPDKLDQTSSSKKPEILVSAFQLLEKHDNAVVKNSLTIPILSQNILHLNHNQNVFSIRFAALDFLNPERNQHEYMMENHDPDWRTSGSEPLATYVKVPPGEYTFRVRATNSQGIYSDEKSIRIIIAPPWWQTWWAQSVFYAGLGLLFFGIYRFQIRRKLEQAEATRIKDLDALKTQLYTNITHEFRTPLTVITGMADQIKDNPKEWFGEGLKMIKRNSTRLLNLVNQMLDLSKLESGKMALQLVQSDLVAYLKYLVESFHSFAEKENIQLHFHSEVKELIMDYDTEKLQQVITNLLSNAVKFTPEGGHIYVHIRNEIQAGNESSNKVLIKVRDTGIGIPEDQIEHIFDRFYQVDDSITRQSEGSGIGLALTHELVKLMDGEINVESDQGSGTEFTIILPVHQTAEITAVAATKHVISGESVTINNNINTEKKSQSIALNSSKPTILLIEDNPDVVAYVASCLYSDYEVLVGKDGQEGIDIAIEHIPDLIITDVMMPYKDGFEVCDTLKSDERTSHVPIIMLTAKADMESKLEGLEKGADAYLAKPFHKTELLVRIKKLLELRQVLQKHYCALAGLTNGQAASASDTHGLDSTENAFIEKARSLVESHIDDFDFSVDQFCKEIGLSRSQLHRKLSALTGLSSNNFIRFIRLNKAKVLLRNPELSITEVAFDTGFNDPSYFGRVFKKEFDMTPKEWQEKVVEM